MKSRLLAFFSFGLALVVLSTGAACGGGGGGRLSLQEYFQRLDKILADTDARFQALRSQPTAGPEATEQDISTRARSFFDGAAAIARDARKSLADLDPPPEAEEAHDQVVNAFGQAAVVFEAFARRVPDVLSASRAEALFDQLFGSIEPPEFRRIDDACKALQALAGANNIDVDLNC